MFEEESKKARHLIMDVSEPKGFPEQRHASEVKESRNV